MKDRKFPNIEQTTSVISQGPPSRVVVTNPQAYAQQYPMQHPQQPVAYPSLQGQPNLQNQAYPIQQGPSSVFQHNVAYPAYPGYPPTGYDLTNPKGNGLPVGNPQIVYINPQPQILNKTGLQKLEEMDGIYIKQKLEMLEVVTGCETENRYYVYGMDKDGNKKSKKLLKCRERSNTCARLCLSGACRPYEMDISSYVVSEDEEYIPFLQLERPCKCTCLCFARPYVSVTLNEGGRNEYIGKIIDPWNWCDMEFNIFDKDNVKKYSIEGKCCQLGVWCRWPCEPCQTVDFTIRSASGEIISRFQKRTAGCIQSMASDADNYALKFPANITGVDKALLMSAVLFLDYRHFDRKPNSDN